MSKLETSTESIIVVAISDLKTGDFVLNLGEVLEIEESVEFYAVIIFRMNQKHVIKFEKDTQLYLSTIFHP